MSVNRLAETLQPAWLRSGAMAVARDDEWAAQAARNLRTAVDVMSFLADPFALAALALALWRLAADLNWADNFFIGQGLFSHWQVWLALAMVLKAGHISLERTLARVPVNKSRTGS